VRRVHVRDERLRHRTAAEAGPHLVAHAIEVAATIRRHRTGQTCNRGASCLSYQRRDLARAQHRQVTWRPPHELVRNRVRSVPGGHTKRRATGGPAARTPCGPADSPRRPPGGMSAAGQRDAPQTSIPNLDPGTRLVHHQAPAEWTEPPQPTGEGPVHRGRRGPAVDAGRRRSPGRPRAPDIRNRPRTLDETHWRANQQAPNLADLARQPTDPERG
jgi:hypothetical protein